MPGSRAVILEVVGVWSDMCDGYVQHLHAFKKTVGVQDEDGPHDFYVGGHPALAMFEGTAGHPDAVNQTTMPPMLIKGVGGNYFDWAVLENAMGKTTEMFR